jgi:hypothetical protein
LVQSGICKGAFFNTVHDGNSPCARVQGANIIDRMSGDSARRKSGFPEFRKNNVIE